ncbi:MAG TPA: cyclase family protein [Anaerolineales bacterium]|nr:cyclase family protein [Anaerolineales bacterium]
MKWIDATLPMRAETVHWPGHPLYTVTQMMSMDQGEVMNVTAVSMCSHFGTHIDAPRHYVDGGTSVDALPAGLLIGPCRVVYYDGTAHIPSDFIEGLALRGVTRLLIKTRNSGFLGESEFREDYIALSIEAAEALVAEGVQLLGVDGYSIGPYDPSLGVPVHQTFLGAGPDQAAIEELDLSSVEPGEYHLIAMPMRLTDLEAAPTRVLLGLD